MSVASSMTEDLWNVVDLGGNVICETKPGESTRLCLKMAATAIQEAIYLRDMRLGSLYDQEPTSCEMGGYMYVCSIPLSPCSGCPSADSVGEFRYSILGSIVIGEDEEDRLTSQQYEIVEEGGRRIARQPPVALPHVQGKFVASCHWQLV
jgi:hypothetical protein